MKKGYYKIKPPTLKEKYIIRTMIIIGCISIICFFCFFFQTDNIGYLPLYFLLCIVLIYGALRNLYLWYHYFSISVPEKPKLSKHLEVDILTTYFPGEPYDMVIKTLKAIQAIEYPHKTYLCDEANDAYLKEECRNLGVIHVTRNNRIDAKAGNINNALKQAIGDICVILDPDHIPQPNFLKNVLPYFEDENIGYVQIVQGYYNKYETLVARGAAEQTFQFYGPMMMSMNTYGTVNAIGANCSFRRSALDSIGGHAPGLAEDMHTAMQLHAKGWKSVYVPKFLAKGLVPADLTSYYKQQLKWSRGTFELLYAVYPKLYSKFTLRQKIHYAILPFHYFIGFIYLIAFLIPILSLFLSKMPWTGNILYFVGFSVPIFMSSLLIRTYIQKWVIEENERGFHFLGGLLQIVSWWVYLLGIIYTLVRKKIPYLPTPKDEQKSIDYKILIPNFLVALFSIIAIIYGLREDFTPFTIVMSCFAGINAGFMFFSFYLANSITNRNRILRANLEGVTVNKLVRIKNIFRKISRTTFQILRPITLPFLLVIVLLSAYSTNNLLKNEWENLSTISEGYRDFQYLGIFEPSDTTGISNLGLVKNLENQLQADFQIISLYIPWGDGNKSLPNQKYLSQINEKGAIPMITWEPWSSRFAISDSINDLKNENNIFKYISEGLMNNYIENMALEIKKNGNPVFLRFAHEFDNPSYPWSKTGHNSPSDFKRAWKHVYKIFSNLDVDNVIWVWNPWRTNTAMEYYPGDQYVDWVGITLLNYGAISSNQNWYSFGELYQPFHNLNKNFNKPVILTEFGSLNLGGDKNKWFYEAFKNINYKYEEIKGIVFFNSKYDKNIPKTNYNYKEPYLDWSSDFLNSFKLIDSSKNSKNNENNAPESFITLNEEKKAFSKEYKGISYKKSDNWSDNYYIASKEVLKTDFKKMKDIGIDLIQVEHSNIYNYNILKYADEDKIKVIYSFWIPDNVNFITDKKDLANLKKDILESIKRLKNNNTIVGWSIKNDFWFKTTDLFKALSLKKHQESYIEWLSDLAIEIKNLDSTRPLIKEVHLTQKISEQLEQFNSKGLRFDFLGISVKNMEYWEDFISYGKKFNFRYIINEISVEDYRDNRIKFGNNTIIIKNWQNQKEAGHVTFDGLLDFDGAKKNQYIELNNLWSFDKYSPNLPEIDILRPAVLIVNNNNLKFTALIKENDNWTSITNNNDFQFKWYLVKYNNFESSIAMKKVGEGNFLDLEIPEDYSNYKLLLKLEKNNFSVSVIRPLNTQLLP